jgi:PAS domain S-box-containing protein
VARVTADSLAAAAYAQAFARAPIGMALVGVDGVFRDANLAFSAMVGRERAELIGAAFQRFTHPDDVDRDFQIAAKVLRGDHDLFAHEKRFLRPNGEIRWVEVDGSLIRDGVGNPVHFVFSALDVTARRRAEEVRDEHLASISHELRTPLTSIRGYAQLLGDEGALPTNLERDSVAAIERNAEAMLTVIEEGSDRLARAVDDHVARSLGCASGTFTAL